MLKNTIQDAFKRLIEPSIDREIRGDLTEKAEEQAQNYGHSRKRELCFLTIHGFLHLLGYDHMTKEEETIMFKRQELILDGFGIKR